MSGECRFFISAIVNGLNFEIFMIESILALFITRIVHLVLILIGANLRKNVKVLIVNKFLHPNGGSETYIFNVGRYLASQGNEVQYFGMDHEGRCVGNAVNAYTSEMDFHCNSILSKVIYSIKTIYSFEARRLIRKVLDDFVPDVVHLNNFNYQLTPSIILEIVKWRKENNKKCRIVYTAHDYQLICPNHMLRNPNTHLNCEKCIGGRFVFCTQGKCIHGSITKSVVGTIEASYWKIRGVYKYIDKIVCPSKFIKSKLDMNPLFMNKTVVIHNFVDAPSYKYEKCENKYVLYFGRLSEEKGVKTLINVCKLLPEISFVFVGSGPLSEELKDIGNVHYLGFLQGDKLFNLIANAWFCVCPSECYEVFGLAIGESLVLGTPVVASSIGGIPESLGQGGILITPGDVKELTDIIRNLWNDNNMIERLRINCKLTDVLSCEQYGEHLLKVYGIS